MKPSLSNIIVLLGALQPFAGIAHNLNQAHHGGEAGFWHLLTAAHHGATLYWLIAAVVLSALFLAFKKS